MMSTLESGKIRASFDLSLLKPFLRFLVTLRSKTEGFHQQFQPVICCDGAQLSSLVSSVLNPHRLSHNEPLTTSKTVHAAWGETQGF